MNIAIFGRQVNTSHLPYIQKLIQLLEKRGVSIYFEKNYLKELISHSVKFTRDVKTYVNHNDLRGVNYLFSLGGDGTLLETITLIKDLPIPVMGINMGRMGFLAFIAKEEIEYAIDDFFEGNYKLEERTTIKVDCNTPIFEGNNFAINEITVHKKDSSSMITIHTFINDEYLNSYWADGLIVATPTGSTGYSLSCGGPIMIPGSDTFVLTPIAPHNLNIRPMVIPSNFKIKLKAEGRNEPFLVTLDSRSETIDSKNELIITRGDFNIKLIRPSEQNFFMTIRKKLMWGADKRN